MRDAIDDTLTRDERQGRDDKRESGEKAGEWRELADELAGQSDGHERAMGAAFGAALVGAAELYADACDACAEDGDNMPWGDGIMAAFGRAAPDDYAADGASIDPARRAARERLARALERVANYIGDALDNNTLSAYGPFFVD